MTFLLKRRRKKRKDHCHVSSIVVSRLFLNIDSPQAANYLDIKPLFDLCCAQYAAILKGLGPEKVAKILGVDLASVTEEYDCIFLFVYFSTTSCSTVVVEAGSTSSCARTTPGQNSNHIGATRGL